MIEISFNVKSHAVVKLSTCCLGSLLWLVAGGNAASSAEADVSFNRDIRPILSENCFVCHGPDVAELQGGLRLDERSHAIGEADSGAPAIVPGDADGSPLIARIESDDEYEIMPPPDSGKILTAEQKQLLRRWVQNDAPYEGHWAFTAPERAKLPATAVTDTKWHTNPIDRFIAAKLATAGLSPSPEADRSTLIRRLALDLTGVPPTPAEVDQFLSDSSESAYEDLVDRLLTSNQYGERMAVSWLDFARYADSNGFQSDGSRDIWAWRDWLIAALNENKPFDQFTIEQLAGDMLDNPTRDQIIATGFNRNHRLNGEGGRIVDEWFVETVIDRVETTGLSWLGLTYNCCRCHDHKYDPISQKEFYSMYAFFNSVDETGVLSPTGKNGTNTPPLYQLSSPETDAKSAEFSAAKQSAKATVDQLVKSSGERLVKWETEIQQNSPQDRSQWISLDHANAKSLGGSNLQVQPDGSVLAKGSNADNDTYEIRSPVALKKLTAVLLETLPDDSLPAKSLGRGSNGNFVLTDLDVCFETADGQQTELLTFAKAMADFEQPGWTAESVRIGKPVANLKGSKHGWAIAGNTPGNNIPRRLVLIRDKPTKIPRDAVVVVSMKHGSPYKDHNVGRFRISVTDTAPDTITVTQSGIPSDVEDALATDVADRSSDQRKQLINYFRASIDQPLIDARKRLETASQAEKTYLASIPTTMIMKEVDPRDAYVLERGEYDKPGEKVGRAVPAFLPPLAEGQPLNRLGLARWIVDRRNPLTARVWVNRAWEHFFGIGLVKTTENFGSQSEYPSHPKLLDWLAVEFMEPSADTTMNGRPAGNWDTKAMHKLMVMSATYRQSGNVTPELFTADPKNRLLARAKRLRLPGEQIRDAALDVSGLLVKRIGGPSVRPFMPEGVWDETSVYGNLRNYKADQGEGSYRKTMYTIWKRTAAPPTMLLFDAPNREVCTIKRSRTNTPLQALSLMNEVTFVEASRALAARLIQQGGNTADERIQYAFKLLFSRPATDDELRVLNAGIENDLTHYQATPDAAAELLSVGTWQPPEDSESLDPALWAAYTLTANVLLNLDEFVTRP